jgi:hypothetical protein
MNLILKGNQFTVQQDLILKKPFTKISLVEWLKVMALSSQYLKKKKKERKKERKKETNYQLQPNKISNRGCSQGPGILSYP